MSQSNLVDRSVVADYPHRTALMTTYFFNNPDPQHKTRAPADDESYIRPWRESAVRLDLPAIVFHDGLSRSFTDRYSEGKVRFSFVDPDSFTLSLNDFRFLVYREFLAQNAGVEAAFMTDGNDVTVVQDPFPMVRPKRLYVGSEPDKLNGNKWVTRRFHFLNSGTAQFPMPKSRFFSLKLYNAGILGGSRKEIVKFLDIMAEGFSKLEPSQQFLNVNMALFNHTVYNSFRRKVVTGEPLHSVFKAFEEERKDVYFIHK